MRKKIFDVLKNVPSWVFITSAFTFIGYQATNGAWWRQKLVEYHLCYKPQMTTYLPVLRRDEFNKQLEHEYHEHPNPLLIDGYPGVGKSTAAQLFRAEHRDIPSAYISLKDSESPTKVSTVLAEQFHYIGTDYTFENEDGALKCLRKALIAVGKRTKTRPILFIDDIEQCLEFNQPPTPLGEKLKSMSLALSDRNVKTIFLSSDSSSRDIMQEMPGVGHRLNFYSMKNLTLKEVSDYITANKKVFEKKFPEAKAISQFYDTFGSSMRHLECFMESSHTLSGKLRR